MSEPSHDLAFARDCWKLHRLGARSVYELLREVGQAGACSTVIRSRVRRYAELDPEIVRAVGGDQMPPVPVYEVRR
jgi:hypothetical protein